ncbi:glycolate oxidase subunit GlcE [Halomonas sp. MMSF_3323]|uniref:glycolate oxidase subunit GlcE n=1 Tax=Halomonas sp. MMSF_3323 TaxID=3046701 RepID=UPI00273F2346|nr:glycolate oxidase subunit GlcE [Halomonas sp. MMSF_3323]
MSNNDVSPSAFDGLAALSEAIQSASAERPLRIVGGNTKAFYGRPVEGTPVSTREHRGITSYDPVELIVSVRAGTLLSALEEALADQGQMLPFEPPHFGAEATVGGTIAAGLSGPRRPWAGSVRDFVLGLRVLDHQGREQRFGGEVMKNVAGYDLSRLMVGAQGTLGLITEVTLKVLPLPTASASLRLEMSQSEALSRLAEWGRKPLPLSAAAWHSGALHLRLEGGTSSVAATREAIGGDTLEADFWRELRELSLPFFRDASTPLWRISLPTNTPSLDIAGVEPHQLLLDWAGNQRWLKGQVDAESLRDAVAQAGGHATCFTPGAAEPFTPLQPVVAKYHERVKRKLDPDGIFNPRRLYPDW